MWVDAGFHSVALLTIARTTGWYVMDDFSTSAAAQVPEPGAPLMLAIGVLGLGRRLSRRGAAGAARSLA